MARVLCAGTDDALTDSRKLLLEHEGHTVTAIVSQSQLAQALEPGKEYDVAVIGQGVHPDDKKNILALVRVRCPSAKILELYSPFRGKVLPEADDWLEVHSAVPPQLGKRVNWLAKGG
jgi:hypothetical protein